MRRGVVLAIAASGYSKGAAALVQLVMVPALAVHWGLALYGQWLMLMAVPFFLAASDFGFSTAAGNRLIGEVARGEHDEARLTMRSARLLVLTLALAVMVIGVAAVFMLPDRLLESDGGMNAGVARQVMVALLAYGLIVLQAQLFSAAAQSMGRQAQAVGIHATFQVIEGGAVLAVVLTGGGPRGAAAAYLVSAVLLLASQMAYAAHVAPWLRGSRTGSMRQRLRELARPALAAMALPLSQAGYLQGTTIALGAAGGAAMVPLYTSLRTLARIALQFASTLAIPLMPVFTGAHALDNRLRMARCAGVLAIAALAIAIVAGLVIGLFGRPLLDLWTGGTIRPPGAMIVLMALSLVFLTLWGSLSFLLLAANRHETYAYAFVALAVIAVAATYVLVDAFGVTGAAIANLGLDAIMAVVVILSLRRLVGKFAFGPDAFLAILPERLRQRIGKRA